MKFVSNNELGMFDFSDCKIGDVNYDGNVLVFTLESLIVLENNSQNSNYTKSYADTTIMTLKNCVIQSAYIAGYKVYDANDNLVEQIDDISVEKTEYNKMIEGFKDSYLCRAMKCESDQGYVYELEVEQEGEEQFQDLRSDMYVVKVEFSEAVCEWDRYLNRVQS